MTLLPSLRLSLLAAFLAVLALLLFAEPALAGIGSYFGGVTRRDQVIQVSVIVMLIALFIMIKKFTPSDR